MPAVLVSNTIHWLVSYPVLNISYFTCNMQTCDSSVVVKMLQSWTVHIYGMGKDGSNNCRGLESTALVPSLLVYCLDYRW